MLNRRFTPSEDELAIMCDPLYMRMKQQIVRNVCAAWEGLGTWLVQRYYPGTTTPPKVTRGENYLDMPYVVLDVPQLKQQEISDKLRIMFWWGHYISLQYFIYMNADTAANLHHYRQYPYTILNSEDLYNNDLCSHDFIPLQDYHYKQSCLTKICQRIELAEFENLEHHLTPFMTHMQTLSRY